MIWQIDTCFSRCEGLNSPVGRHSSLWVIVVLFQVLTAALWVGPGGSRALQKLCWKAGATKRIQTTATGPLRKPQPWPNVETLQAAGPIIQIVCLIKGKCHREGTLNSNSDAVCPHSLYVFFFFIVLFHGQHFIILVSERNNNEYIMPISFIILRDFPFYNNN